MLLEVDQLKQFDLITLRGEDQLMLFAIEAQLEGSITQGRLECIPAFFQPVLRRAGVFRPYL